MLLKAIIAGMLIIIPVIVIEHILTSLIPDLLNLFKAFYNAFLVAGFTEELFKFLALYILVWVSKDFNEKFDGIVYAVFISLGFAAIENIMYVFQFGAQTGYFRAIISVPAHAIFGTAMGYNFAMAKFVPQQQNRHMTRAFLIPLILHGFFDFILMLENYFLLFVFIPYVIFLYIGGFRRMKALTS